MLYADDVDTTALDGLTVAVIGYGSQGHAHALNLRDSGVTVLVGLPAESKSIERAAAAGFVVDIPAAVAAQADITVVLVPDERHGALWREELRSAVRPGTLLLLSHGFSIVYGEIDPHPDLDVAMVAPKGPGHLVRSTYRQGCGVPALLAVSQNVTGDARRLALAYADALGSTRAGVLETTFSDETETDLFGEQAVLCGGLTELVRAGFETLVAAGYDEQLAYFECLHELKLIVDLMYEAGIGGMRSSCSNTAEYGDITRGPRIVGSESRWAMQAVLEEIRSGAFAREWLAEAAAGAPRLTAERRGLENHLLETTGRRLRAQMPWLESEAVISGQDR